MTSTVSGPIGSNCTITVPILVFDYLDLMHRSLTPSTNVSDAEWSGWSGRSVCHPSFVRE